MRSIHAAAQVERHHRAGLPVDLLAALEREAAHLTRRDGRRRLVVRWGDDPPEIDDGDYSDGEGPMILATIDIA